VQPVEVTKVGLHADERLAAAAGGAHDVLQSLVERSRFQANAIVIPLRLPASSHLDRVSDRRKPEITQQPFVEWPVPMKIVGLDEARFVSVPGQDICKAVRLEAVSNNR
jgi:hypothetical protein